MTDQPVDQYVIDNLDTLKVISDERRLQILELLIRKPHTVKQIAAHVDVAPTKLYYHIKQLEDHSLIHVVDTQVVSGIIEKTYRAVARSYTIDENLLPYSDETVKAAIEMALRIIDRTRADIVRCMNAGLFSGEQAREAPGHIGGAQLFLTDEQAREFEERFRALLDEYPTTDDNAPDTRPYALLFAFYPTLKEDR